MPHSQLANIDYNLIKILIALLEEQGVSAASKKLNLSQSAVSHALAKLRSTMDDPILVRSGNKMLPTSRAQSVLPQAKMIGQQLESIFANQPIFNPERDEHYFHLAMSDYGQLCFFPKLASYLATSAPGINIRISRIQQSLQVEKILGKQLINRDLDFIVAPTQPVPKDTKFNTIFKDSFTVAYASNHPRISGSINLDQYLREEHLLVSPHGHGTGFVDNILQAKKTSRKIKFILPDFITGIQMIPDTEYLLTVPQKLAEHFSPHQPLSYSPPPFTTPQFGINLYWHRCSETTPAQRWFINICAKLFPPNSCGDEMRSET